MEQYEKHIITLRDALRQQDYYNSMKQLLEFDMWQTLPPAGRDFRGDTAGFLAKKSASDLLSPAITDAVEYFRDMPQAQFREIRHWSAARRLTRLYDRASRIPADLEAALAACTLKCQMIWREARKASSFDLYRPHMKKLFELKRQIAQAANPNVPPFQVMIDDFDQGLCIDEIDRLFDVLKKEIPRILAQAETHKGNPDPTLLAVTAERGQAERFMSTLMARTGIDLTRTSFGSVLHPISYSIGPRDVRVTVNYEKNIWQLLCSFLHECGHAQYQYGTSEDLIEFGLWGGIQGAMHEGVARFYENMIGRSREFIAFAQPYISEAFPETAAYSPDVVYDTLNTLSPGATRLTADEVTYSLHPIIRFEMEKDYFDGKIKIEDFREIWNEKYRSYLGVVPASDTEGILQDISWSSGYLGYFQSYTLGNLYGAQIRSALLADIPDVYQEIRRGNFVPLTQWMQTHVFRYGSLYNASEMIRQISGKSLGAGAFVDYLQKKYCGNT